MSEELINDLEEFTCVMYGRPKVKYVNTLRYQMLSEKCADGELNPAMNIDMVKVTPCHDCLVRHITRVTYQVAIWKRANSAKSDILDTTHGHG